MQDRLYGLRKAVQASPGHKTRFHTLRDKLVPAHAAFIDLPMLIARRVGGRASNDPWLTRDAVRFLRTAIQPDWCIFEFGSGVSTPWYAQRASSVLSVENDPDWYRRIADRLEPYPNATIEQVARQDFPGRISREEDATFDLIVVDGDDSGLTPDQGRIGCVRAAAPKVKPGGILLLDNSDRPRYSAADTTLAGWNRTRFAGFSSGPLTPVETTLYWRPRN